LIEKIKKYSDLKYLSEEIANEWFEGANQALKKQTTFSVGLSGGKTPSMVFQHLKKFDNWKIIPWNVVHIFWADERCVPPDHSESNYRLASELILKDLPIPEENIHRIHGENDPMTEANRYTEELMGHFNLNIGQVPSLDWIFLGVGTDGHTASIFPKSTIKDTVTKLCYVATHPKTGQKRITLSLSTINMAKRITVIIAGQEKATIVSKIMNPASREKHLPVKMIRLVAGSILWALDEEAASKINV
tara:strand:- start:3991 stop:4731 length:741 start_codon:yes stop_codon:yes gene_type:complete